MVTVENNLIGLEKNQNICTLTLNRPHKRNSLSPELVKLLLITFEQLASDGSIRVVVLRGAGDEAFCSGYDIRSLPTVLDDNVQEKLERLKPIESLFQAVVNYPFPVIAMLNGMAFGAGCELAVCCDIRIGAEDIRMGMPPAKLGMVYPWEGLKRFIQVIGLRGTREMFFTGHTYRGSRLKELGLVDHLVPRDELTSFTYQMAQEIAANAPLSLKGTKKVINLLLDSIQLEEENRIKARSLTQAAFLSEDVKEGQLAFLEKRKPQFKGR